MDKSSTSRKPFILGREAWAKISAVEKVNPMKTYLIDEADVPKCVQGNHLECRHTRHLGCDCGYWKPEVYDETTKTWRTPQRLESLSEEETRTPTL
jgi:hypothetical protein